MRPALPTRAYWQPDTNRYVDRKEVKASYWKDGRMSPGLLRARRRFRTPNAIVGVALLAFVVGVFSYSMAAVRQDVFDDLDDEVKEKAILNAKRAAFARTSTRIDSARNPVPSPIAPEQRRGVLVTLLDGRFPWLLDPTRKTLVWGAPPVDNIGRLGDKPKA
ncbi:hypothetical protein C8R43DRAFT_869789 [Mycena crocata]|nr:hypothetical protein C8R43DRAFT_869789 [Mycena crocata]